MGFEHRFDRRWGIAAVLAVCFLASGAAFVSLRGGEPELDPHRFDEARVAMERLAGGPPERCVFAGPDTQVCRWRVQGRLFGGPQTTASQGDGVHLVCELHAGLDTEPDCTAHAVGDPGAELPAVSASPPASHTASQSLPLPASAAYAATVIDLSHLLGDVPDACRTGVGVQTCAWRIAPGQAGDFDVPSFGAVLECALPLDGSPREPSSCSLRAPAEAP